MKRIIAETKLCYVTWYHEIESDFYDKDTALDLYYDTGEAELVAVDIGDSSSYFDGDESVVDSIPDTAIKIAETA